MTNSGIYIHIPFCREKCAYCHFLSFPLAGIAENVGKRYANALMRELRVFSSGCREEPLVVDSIYFGGGTPSLVPAEWVSGVLDECRRQFAVTDDCEITLEANPGTVSPEKANAYRLAGVNRVSLGAQSFDDAELHSVGRIHGAAAITDSLAVLGRGERGVGFENISLDLMLGLPGQTPRSWRETLRTAANLPVRHISIYMLELDKSSPLRARAAAGNLTFPDDDLVADLYEETIGYLNSQGLGQYEISNFARQGHLSRHNLKYWRRVPVYGFGLGSHFFDGWRRYANVSDFDEYFRRIDSGRSPVAWQTEITDRQAVEEMFFLGLRLVEGVDLRGIPAAGRRLLEERRQAVEEFCSAGLLEWTETHLRLTRRGMLLSNEIMQTFV
ncbi:MAG: radical SAM family heme chaperone HemW [Acidobacteriota bacterium]|nr:radical SAM family heme chaperone HemW [Acidobacteriota bacterium]